jgi:hypothetical protein
VSIIFREELINRGRYFRHVPVMFAMSLTIQDFRAGTFLRGPGERHSDAQAQLTAYLFRCNSCPIVAVAFLGPLLLAFHAGRLANKCRASARRSLV